MSLIHRISQLYQCVKSLGFWIGIVYFGVNLACEKDPSLVLEWADNCENRAKELFAKGKLKDSLAVLSWASQLRFQHARYMEGCK